MANRSKKAVISARIDPLLKAGLELAATTQNEKIVALLECGIQGVLSATVVDDPFGEKPDDKTSFIELVEKIWSEDDVVYKLRVGGLGFKYADLETVDIATLVSRDEYFRGDFNLYGDLKVNRSAASYMPAEIHIDLELVRGEWAMLNEYVRFIQKNKILDVNYHGFKAMIKNS
ncbi:hypothetical protein [Pseudomonas shirazensis]|uniref:hypothetical protein n=1 Tax=Pseudomonas shirazensis TaxID=2745494 RepID=UPI003D2B4668